MHAEEQGGRLTVGYLAGAPRVTTRGDSRSTGPRAHVTGLIGGFRALGHRVTPFVAGDRLPGRLSAAGDAGTVAGGSWRGRLVDTARLGAGPVLGAWARSVVGAGADVWYERQATYQRLGRYRPRGAPWVVESNGPFWYEASAERGSLSFPRLARHLETAAYREADLVVAVSEPLRALLVAECGLDPDRVLVVPNAVDPSRFPARSSSAEGAGRPGGGALTAVFVGHLIGWAGLEHLVDAVAQARADGADVRLRIVGGGPAEQDLRDRVRARGLTGAVDLLGHRPWEEVAGLLASADVAVSAQVPMAIGAMYHSPLKLYEYLAASLPVIATDFPDARSLLSAPGAGWTVPPGDVGALAAALSDAARDRSRLPAMGAAGRDHVLAHHTWEHRAALVVDELRRRGLVRPGPAPGALAPDRVGASR